MSDQPKNFMIIGHGNLNIDSTGNITTFNGSNINVLTFAGPTSSCIYSPFLLEKLRNALVQENTEMNTFDGFSKTILKVEKKTIGKNYCSDEWVKFVEDVEKYETKNSCTQQQNTIQDKTFVFLDRDPVLLNVMGIWDLKTGTNILSPEVLSPAIFERLYRIGMKFSFKNIAQLIRKLYGPDGDINILDCSCSVLFHENNKLINDPRSVRRFSRQMSTVFKSMSKPKTIRNKSALSSMSVKSTSAAKGTRKQSVLSAIKSASTKSAKSASTKSAKSASTKSAKSANV